MKQNYRTRDLFEAAFLEASGHKLIAAEKDPTGRVFFIFQDSTKVGQSADLYWSRKAVINAFAFVESYRSLKPMIFTAQAQER